MEPSPQRGDMFTGENSTACKILKPASACRSWVELHGSGWTLLETPRLYHCNSPIIFPKLVWAPQCLLGRTRESENVELLYHGRLNTNLSTLFLSPSIPFPWLITLVCKTFWVTEDFSDLSDFFRNKSFMSMLKNAATTEKGKFFFSLSSSTKG